MTSPPGRRRTARPHHRTPASPKSLSSSSFSWQLAPRTGSRNRPAPRSRSPGNFYKRSARCLSRLPADPKGLRRSRSLARSLAPAEPPRAGAGEPDPTKILLDGAWGSAGSWGAFHSPSPLRSAAPPLAPALPHVARRPRRPRQAALTPTRPPDRPFSAGSAPARRPLARPPASFLASFSSSIWDSSISPRLLTPPRPSPRHAAFPLPAAGGLDPRGLLRRAERTAGLQACTAQVLCQPLVGRRGVDGLESHMAVGPARAPNPPAPRRVGPEDLGRSPQRRATCLLPLGPIVHAAATPTGSQARAPIARIRTLALPLHPAVAPAPPPPSAAAP